RALTPRLCEGRPLRVERGRPPGARAHGVPGIYLQFAPAADPVDALSRQTVTLFAPGSASAGIGLKPGAFKSGLALPLLERGQNPANAAWKLTAPGAAAQKFSPQNLRTIGLVVTYASKPSF